MPLLFAVVARGTTILAKYASCAGNFNEVVDQVLAKIPPDSNKLTYSHGSYLFHYISSSRITYLCITDDDYERSRAFQFLGEIQRRFETQYGSRALTALPYAMNSEFSKILAAQMRHFASDSIVELDKVDRVQGQVDELKGIMVRNIDTLASRGEKLELLVDKTDDLNTNGILWLLKTIDYSADGPTAELLRLRSRQKKLISQEEYLDLLSDKSAALDTLSVSFKKTSRNLARSMWWKNVKLTVIIIVVVIVSLYIIVSISCGGLAWQKCVK